MRGGATPVPIPNTTVKTKAADGTTLETMWESRRMPGFYFRLFKIERVLKARSNLEPEASFTEDEH